MPRQADLSFVADENFAIVRQLRAKGFTVLSIGESFSSIPDMQVLQITVDRNAVLLTEDKDFGELVHRLRIPHCGILLVRLLKMSGYEKTERVFDVIANQETELINSFSVLSSDSLRIRPAK